MSLADLTVDDLRCLRHVQLSLHPGQNLVWGANGSGKTSILEAIFLLGRGRSFRTRNSERLITHGRDRLVVFGRTADTPAHTLGFQASRKEGTVAKIDGSFASSLAELSSVFAVQVIEPGAHKLVEEGGHRRRRWMDWAVFHVEPTFVDHWTRYTRALKQRNAALRSQPDQASLWDSELARAGEAIAESRRLMLERLQPYWRQLIDHLTGLNVEFHYSRGWAQDVPLGQALQDSQDRDRQRGMTHPGPHRGDVLLRLDGKPAREVLSRGQQKLVAVAMTLSQLYLLKDISGSAPTLLLDDPAAELDGTRLQKFIDQVGALQSQLIVTSLHPNLSLWGTPDVVFHVEQGAVRGGG